MRSKIQNTHECRDCKNWKKQSTSDYCSKCREKHRCPFCSVMSREIVVTRCVLCKILLSQHMEIMKKTKSFPKSEVHLKEMATRAAKRLPLTGWRYEPSVDLLNKHAR